MNKEDNKKEEKIKSVGQVFTAIKKNMESQY
jgi:hypothetical protein